MVLMLTLDQLNDRDITGANFAQRFHHLVAYAFASRAHGYPAVPVESAEASWWFNDFHLSLSARGTYFVRLNAHSVGGVFHEVRTIAGAIAAIAQALECDADAVERGDCPGEMVVAVTPRNNGALLDVAVLDYRSIAHFDPKIELDNYRIAMDPTATQEMVAEVTAPLT